MPAFLYFAHRSLPKGGSGCVWPQGTRDPKGRDLMSCHLNAHSRDHRREGHMTWLPVEIRRIMKLTTERQDAKRKKEEKHK